MLRSILLVLGVLCMLMGVLWIGQGLGYVHWPPESFMIDRRPWAVRGAVLLAIGVVLAIVARRLPRR